MKNEFTLAFNEVLEEKQLPKEIILKALESAMVSAYRRAVNASNAQHVEAKMDPDTGKVVIYAEKEVVDVVQDDRTEVSLEEARRYNPEAELSQMVIVESTPANMSVLGRVAAQTARQVIQQRIRDAERQAQMAYYDKQMGEIVSGIVQAVNAQGLTIGMEMKAEGSMPRKEMIPGERFHIHDRVRALVAEVKDAPRGPQIILSRTHRNFLRRLLENEVPEIYHGVVEIRSIAREPGERAKVAVSATQSGIDPVGACVGIRGVRIQAIVRELHDEKIDVIEWNADSAQYIAKAISPARVSGVYLNEKSANGKTATVVVPEDQLSLAIGRDGQNARLAAKLTGWRIDIKSVPEAASDVLHKLANDPTYAAFAQAEAETAASVENILAKKSEGRALSPEEYTLLTHFVDRVEKRTIAKRQPEKVVEDTRLIELRAMIAPSVYEQDILDSGLPEHIAYQLQEAGISTTGEMLVTVRLSPDDILKLPGIGARAMTEINKLADKLLPAAILRAPELKPVEAEPEAAVIAEAPAVETPVIEEVEAPAAAVEEAAVVTAEPLVEVQAEPAVAVEEKEEEEVTSLDELFTMKPEVFQPTESTEEEEEDSGGQKTGKKKKKKGRHVEVEYDPDRDLVITRKKHKRGGWDWEQ